MSPACSPLVIDIFCSRLPSAETRRASNSSPRGVFRQRGDLPVFFRDEALDLGFAVADEAQRHRLHAAGRAGARQLAPQHRRQVEADEIVERAARQIGVDQRHVDIARIGHRVEHGLLGDGVEDDALDRLVAEHRFFFSTSSTCQEIASPSRSGSVARKRPSDVLHGVGDVLQPLVRGGVDFPGHLEVLVGQHRAVLGGQVADMAEGGQHLVAGAQILVDRLGLGRRFHDDDIHAFISETRGVNGARSWPRTAICAPTWTGDRAWVKGPAAK